MPYQAGDTLLTVTFENTTGMSDEVFVHTMAFRDVNGAPSVAARAALTDEVVDFYAILRSNGNSLFTYLGGQVSRVREHHIKQYVIVPGNLGSPVTNQAMNIGEGPGAASNYPAEVAIRLGVRADTTGIPEEVGAERPASSRRGGFFFGPLVTAAAGNQALEPRVSSDFLVTAEEAMVALAAGVSSDIGAGIGPRQWLWSVWSRDDQELYPIVEGRIDNAFDTQRKRGRDMTEVEIFALPSGA